jgi:SAM-dependent methyltransferase
MKIRSNDERLMNQNARKSVLNAGCGPATSSKLPSVFAPDKWAEVRLDIDPRTQPDILSSFADMSCAVGDARFDALFCSHAIEHLYAHEVIPAFREFLRVIKPEGFALVTCPDLAAIARHLLTHGAEAIAYQSPAGPIRPIDMLFGHSQSIADGRISMAHNTGFTAQRLARTAQAAGFGEVRIIEGGAFDLWAVLLAPGASVAEIAGAFDGSELRELFQAEGKKAPAPVPPSNVFG